MEKIRVFLDTNILILYFRGKPELKKLFSKEVLKRVQFVINPIVFQEIILVSDSLKEKLDFKKINNNIELIPLNKSDLDYDKIRNFRNMAVHANDILILQTSLSNCDYLLTEDKQLLSINDIKPLSIISIKDFFKLLEATP